MQLESRKVMCRKVGRDGSAGISCRDHSLRLVCSYADFRRLIHNASRTSNVYLRRRNIVTPAVTRACCIDARHSYEEISSGLSVVSWWHGLRCNYVVLLRCNYVVQKAVITTRESSTGRYSLNVLVDSEKTHMKSNALHLG